MDFTTLAQDYLKMHPPSLLFNMSKLFNMSLSTSQFPTLWKCSKVVALFKSGDKCNVTNYRPISVLPTISKILERAVFDQLYSYNLLSIKQFGFRHRLSTTVALAEFCDNILSGAAFLDLAKAFDTVADPILCSSFMSTIYQTR